MNKIIVTRHTALIEYLREIGLATAETPVLSHATWEQISGKDVLGVLPLNLAVHANSVTEVPMEIPAELRGKELDLDTMRKYAGVPRTYTVFLINR